MRTLILGAGGIGGYYGGRLVEAGADVTFFVRPARAERLAANGLVIRSPKGDATLAVTAVTQAEGAYDLVILSCKAYDLDAAIEAIRPAVGPSTTILPLLNGLAHLDRLDAAFGPDRVIGGTAHISVTMDPDGTIRNLADLHLLTYGERDAAALPARCDAIEALFATARFDGKRSDTILREMWEKFAFITAAAGITCLMRASVGAIMTTHDGARLTERMLDECAAVATAAGFPPPAEVARLGQDVPDHQGLAVHRLDAARPRGRRPCRGRPSARRHDRARRRPRHRDRPAARRVLRPASLRRAAQRLSQA